MCNDQSITGAMSTINPPVELEDASKQYRLEYIQNIATQADFDYPQVPLAFTYCGVCVCESNLQCIVTGCHLATPEVTFTYYGVCVCVRDCLPKIFHFSHVLTKLC